MVKIFISYRRADSQLVTDRIHDHMVIHFDNNSVFQDVDSIPFGADFPEYLSNEVNKCDVVLVVIGKEWVRIMQERQDQADDFVRIEVESALRLNKLVIPVLVNGATMPNPNHLPASVRDLCRKNAAPVRPNPDFRRDCQRLADGIKQVMGVTVQPSQPKPTANPTQSALQRAQNFTGKRNSDWKPVIVKLGEIDPQTPIPDMEMCLVPVGKFMMGADGDLAKYDDEKPAHPQTIAKPYWIARYPVTNGQWRRAVEAGAVNKPKTTTWYDDKTMQDAPVVYVDWFMSQQFAQWARCALPSEMHWEYASRGVESWVYPWGNDFVSENLIYEKTPKYGDKMPAPVTMLPQGASWVGAMHMSGNVWEWTSSEFKPYPYSADDGRERDTGKSTDVRRVLRGGAFDYFTHGAGGASRSFANPHSWLDVFGFRLVCAPVLNTSEL